MTSGVCLAETAKGKERGARLFKSSLIVSSVYRFLRLFVWPFEREQEFQWRISLLAQGKPFSSPSLGLLLTNVLRYRISSIQSPIQRPTSPDQAGIITDLVVARFLDTFCPDPRSNCDTPLTFRLAASVAVSSQLLYHAFQAVSFALLGRASLNKSVETAACEIYAHVLKDLQRALYDPEESRSTDVLVTVGLMFIFEVRPSVYKFIVCVSNKIA